VRFNDGSTTKISKGRIYVFNRESLQLVADAWAFCGHGACAGGNPFDWFLDVLDFLGCVIQLNPLDVCFPPDTPVLGPLQEPSLAIVDAAAAVGDPDRPVVVATTGYCASALRFSPLLSDRQSRLQPLWGRQLVGNCRDPVRCTSPAVIVGTQTVFGDENGRVKSLDVQTGALFWEHDFDVAVQSPPVAFLRQIYLVMANKLIVLDSDGTLLQEVPLQGLGQSAALSLDVVHVATTAGIHTFRLDPQQGSNFDGSIASTTDAVWAVSGLAIAEVGTLYVSTPDGFIHAYAQVAP
jgi:outer membrane protein assembly factor BamB